MFKFILVSLAALFPLTACGSSPTARRYDDVMSGSERRMEIEGSGDIMKMCDIYANKAYFAYASDVLDDDDKMVVKKIGECMLNGKLAGRSILVTGYTDFTGPRAMNQELGLERSRAVADMLVSQGIPARRIFVRSRGERDAEYTTDTGTAYDRKIVMTLVVREK